MPAVNLIKKLYDELIRRDIDPTEYVNHLVEHDLHRKNEIKP